MFSMVSSFLPLSHDYVFIVRGSPLSLRIIRNQRKHRDNSPRFCVRARSIIVYPLNSKAVKTFLKFSLSAPDFSKKIILYLQEFILILYIHTYIHTTLNCKKKSQSNWNVPASQCSLLLKISVLEIHIRCRSDPKVKYSFGSDPRKKDGFFK